MKKKDAINALENKLEFYKKEYKRLRKKSKKTSMRDICFWIYTCIDILKKMK